MPTVNIHEAKTDLSRLIKRAVAGESFVIAKAGKPLVEVVRLDVPSDGTMQRLGFLRGTLTVPNDFDRLGQKEIAAMFGISS